MTKAVRILLVPFAATVSAVMFSVAFYLYLIVVTVGGIATWATGRPLNESDTK